MSSAVRTQSRQEVTLARRSARASLPPCRTVTNGTCAPDLNRTGTRPSLPWSDKLDYSEKSGKKLAAVRQNVLQNVAIGGSDLITLWIRLVNTWPSGRSLRNVHRVLFTK